MITSGIFLALSFLFSLSLFIFSYIKNDNSLEIAAFCAMIMALIEIL